MERKTIEFWFEFASTYSYPAAMRIEGLAAERGCAVVWKPFLLGPIFKAQGWDSSPFNLYPAKGRYMWRDVERVCNDLGIPWRKPSTFPRNGVTAARVACAHSFAPWLPAFVRAVYSAGFAQDQEIGEADVVRGCLAGLVPDPDAILLSASSGEAKGLLRRNTEQAMELGIFGAPSFMVGSELFWGNDRLEQAVAWACR